jgi:hypothetical protein
MFDCICLGIVAGIILWAAAKDWEERIIRRATIRAQILSRYHLREQR